MALRILITGAGGQLGRAMMALPATQGVELMPCSRQVLDLTDEGATLQALDRLKPQIIINAAAYTAVDLAETHSSDAYLLNKAVPEFLATACRKKGIVYSHISTDYVFDGTGTNPWFEQDTPNPLNIYGKSKHDGERAVLEAYPEALILRTSWVFSEHGKNFFKTMMQLATKHPELSIVNDQVSGPTYAGDLANILLVSAIQRYYGHNSHSGLLHFSGFPYVSWCEFAQSIFDQAVFYGFLNTKPKLTGIPSSEYPQTAQRPLNSRLGLKQLQEVGYTPSDWQEGIMKSLKAMNE